MQKSLKDRMRTWLIYKLLCVLKWSAVNFLVAGYHKMSAIIKAHYQDKRLGIETSDFVSFRNIRDSFRDGIYKDGELYEAISYDKLESLFAYLQPAENDVFMDLGCGKGRAVLFASQYKLKQAVGVELKSELFEIALDNLSRFKPTSPVTFLNADAATVDLGEVTVLFLYNPFGPMTLTRVLNNMKTSLQAHPRNIRIVYFNSVYADLLNGQDWLVREHEIGCSRNAVWRNRC